MTNRLTKETLDEWETELDRSAWIDTAKVQAALEEDNK